MTDELVCAHTEFADLASYLDGYAITGARLQTLGVPARVLAARDDPIIPAPDLARLAHTPLLRITTTAHGGHCGFLGSWSGTAFGDEFTLREFEAFQLPRASPPRTA
jgi:predicted alpha/beta-fold hydrolase